MIEIDKIWKNLVANDFKVSTDTRVDITGSVFFALRGENFDGNNFIKEAINKGAILAITDNPLLKSLPNTCVVKDTLKTLQQLARKYRDQFVIPIVAIGGSNGKTTTRELVRCVLQTKYKVYTTENNLNNDIGLPLSILSMKHETEIGLFEIGANHLGEHTELLEILRPTHVIVTNNGLDHLEGFGSPSKVVEANDEIKNWAKKHLASIIENKNHGLSISTSLPLTINMEDVNYLTNLVGDYNLENIDRALSIGQIFEINPSEALLALKEYFPTSHRSMFLKKDDKSYVLDCYNANPTSMILSLESFVKYAKHPRGVILGDMLELGTYAGEEHKKIIDYLALHDLDQIVLIGDQFKKALEKTNLKHHWFENSSLAKDWFEKQNLTDYIILLKGSRGIKVEKIIFP